LTLTSDLFLLSPSFSSPSLSASLTRFLPLLGVSLLLFVVFFFALPSLALLRLGVRGPSTAPCASGVSVPRFGLLLEFCSLAVCLFLVLILDGESSPSVEPLFVLLESLSHSLASSSLSTDEFSSAFETDEVRAGATVSVGACGSGVCSFFVLVLLFVRVLRIRLNEPCRRRRCGRLLFAPGVFFHR
jgi:hypothetical protein